MKVRHIMTTLNLSQLITMLGHIENGHADFNKKLKACTRPLIRLWKWRSNSINEYANRPEVNEKIYKYVFEEGNYNRKKLIKLKALLRGILTDFIELHKVRSTSEGQNFIAELYNQHGYTNRANEANKESLLLSQNEQESKRWQAIFTAHKALYLRGTDNNLRTAKQALLLYFLTNYLKFTIEELTLFRIEKNKGVVGEVIRKEMKLVLALLPAQTPPIIAIQAKAVEYFESPGFERYEAFKTMFLQKIGLIESEKKHLLNSLINAIALYPNPNEKIIREYLPLYREGIEKELFNYDDNLEIKTVCNILGVADFLGVPELTKLVRKKLVPLLTDKRERGWCELLSEVYILSENKEFDKALLKIKELDKENSRCFDINLRKNILKIKSLYDVSVSSADAFDRIKNARNNFDKFLKRNLENKNLNLITKQQYTNFLNILINISNVHGLKCTKNDLLEKLANFNGVIVETRWLKEKIAERPF